MRRTRLLASTIAVGLAGIALWASAASALLSDVRSGNFYFEDASVGDGQVVITAGDQIRFIIEDSGPGTPHTVDIDALGVHSGNLAKGDTFTTGPLTTPGTYALYCRLHRKRGHETTLIILPATATTTTTTTTAVPTTTITTPPTTTAPPSGSTTTSSPFATTTTTTTTTAAATAGTPTSTSEPVPDTATGEVTSSTIAPDRTGETTTSSGEGGDNVSDGDDDSATAILGEPSGDLPPPPDASLAPTGRGEFDLETLEPLPVAPGSLEAILGRPPAGDGPWTRAVRSSLLALIPMALAAGVVLLRYRSALQAANSAVRSGRAAGSG